MASRTTMAMLVATEYKKKNRNRGGQQKPAEVSDEDVARQVKGDTRTPHQQAEPD